MSLEYIDFFIDGEKRHFTDKSYQTEAPADRVVIGECPDAGEEDVNAAVAAANKAYTEVWKDFDPVEREKLLWKWADVIEKNAEKLGEMSGKEGGTPNQADGYRYSAEYIRYFAGYATKNYGDLTVNNEENLCYVVKEPIGTVAVLPAWNTGGNGAIHKMTPALVCGNTVVIKTAAETPLASLMLADTIIEAGFPKGVINIIAGSNRYSGQLVINHPDVQFVSYTGSVPVGQYIMEKSSPDLKHIGLELGGKSPFIVFPDVDIDATAKSAVDTIAAYQGQICSSNSRIIVHESIKDEFVAKMKEYAETYRPSLPDDMANVDGPTFGPLFNKRRLDTVVEYVELGKQEAKLVTGGEQVTEAPFDKGYYFPPTIFEYDDDSSRVCQEEIFGPVTCVFSFKDKEEALHLGNNTEFALAASVWTHDQKLIQYFTRNLISGTVWVRGHNQWLHHNTWGGPKLSGVGREWGKFVLDHYHDLKTVWINI